jgi:hypothetical protein
MVTTGSITSQASGSAEDMKAWKRRRDSIGERFGAAVFHAS